MSVFYFIGYIFKIENTEIIHVCTVYVCGCADVNTHFFKRSWRPSMAWNGMETCPLVLKISGMLPKGTMLVP